MKTGKPFIKVGKLDGGINGARLIFFKLEELFAKHSRRFNLLLVKSSGSDQPRGYFSQSHTRARLSLTIKKDHNKLRLKNGTNLSCASSGLLLNAQEGSKPESPASPQLDFGSRREGRKKMYGSGLKEWLEGSLLKYTALERAKTAAPEKVLTAKKAMNIDG